MPQTNLHKVVFLFDNTRQETPLANRLESELTGVATSILNQEFGGVGLPVISSKLIPDPSLQRNWAWYGKIGIDTALTSHDYFRGSGTQTAWDDIALRLRTALENDPFTDDASIIRVK